ncbi:15192_t:CDS:2 [Funneliformis geosporum]|uniref:15192_t:CDS:1 n=1 Tax=Funneliformis geosporum TaxID=1117311 RepID=A0A9W4WRR3_9GLOM|nr:15192_t:CDS:2 [Funneliformis geosporum]
MLNFNEVMQKLRKPRMVDAETQTELSYHDLHRMDVAEQGIKELILKSGMFADKKKKKDEIIFTLDVIERGIAHLKEDKEHNKDNGKELEKRIKLLEQDLKSGKIAEENLEARLKELEKMGQKKETEFQKTLKIEKKEWERITAELKKDYENKTEEQKEIIDDKLAIIKELELKFEDREEQIRALNKDQGLIEIQMGVIKRDKERIEKELFEKGIQIENLDIEINTFTKKQSYLLRHLDEGFLTETVGMEGERIFLFKRSNYYDKDVIGGLARFSAEYPNPINKDQVCKCAYLKSIGDDDENTDEEKKPSKSSQLEHQLHELSLKKEELEDELETEREAHLAGVDATASWYKREHRKELETLEEKRRRLSNENKKLKTKIAELEEALNKYQTKLENITTQTFDILDIPSQQEAFQEQPPKN